jgi:hypothetical protein
LPEPETAEAALDFLFEALSGLFMGTRLEDDPLNRLWSLVNLLNGKADRNSRRPSAGHWAISAAR